jgi:hypothetical protein
VREPKLFGGLLKIKNAFKIKVGKEGYKERKRIRKGQKRMNDETTTQKNKETETERDNNSQRERERERERERA